MTTTPPETGGLYPWLDATEVLDRLGLDATSGKAPQAERARRAAAAHVQRMRRDLMVQLVETDPVTGTETIVGYEFTPTEDVTEAAHLIVSRLFARVGTPTAASFTELGAAEVARFDPDVAPLLGTGRFAAPRIG